MDKKENVSENSKILVCTCCKMPKICHISEKEEQGLIEISGAEIEKEKLKMESLSIYSIGDILSEKDARRFLTLNGFRWQKKDKSDQNEGNCEFGRWLDPTGKPIERGQIFKVSL